MKDKLIGAAILLALLSGLGALVYGQVQSLKKILFHLNRNSPDCISAAGLVFKKYETGVKTRAYKVEYRYKTTDGKSFEQEEAVDFNTYVSSRVGERIKICYLKKNPSRSIIRRNNDGEDEIFINAVLWFGILIAVLIGIRGYRKLRKKEQSG